VTSSRSTTRKRADASRSAGFAIAHGSGSAMRGGSREDVQALRPAVSPLSFAAGLLHAGAFAGCGADDQDAAVYGFASG
jgi:hypothetical protein